MQPLSCIFFSAYTEEKSTYLCFVIGQSVDAAKNAADAAKNAAESSMKSAGNSWIDLYFTTCTDVIEQAICCPRMAHRLRRRLQRQLHNLQGKSRPFGSVSFSLLGKYGCHKSSYIRSMCLDIANMKFPPDICLRSGLYCSCKTNCKGSGSPPHFEKKQYAALLSLIHSSR